MRGLKQFADCGKRAANQTAERRKNAVCGVLCGLRFFRKFRSDCAPSFADEPAFRSAVESFLSALQNRIDMLVKKHDGVKGRGGRKFAAGLSGLRSREKQRRGKTEAKIEALAKISNRASSARAKINRGGKFNWARRMCGSFGSTKHRTPFGRPAFGCGFAPFRRRFYFPVTSSASLTSSSIIAPRCA